MTVTRDRTQQRRASIAAVVVAGLMAFGGWVDSFIMSTDLNMPMFHADTAEVAPLVAPYVFALANTKIALAVALMLVGILMQTNTRWARPAALVWSVVMVTFLVIQIAVVVTVIFPLYHRDSSGAAREAEVVRNICLGTVLTTLNLALPCYFLFFFRKKRTTTDTSAPAA